MEKLISAAEAKKMGELTIDENWEKLLDSIKINAKSSNYTWSQLDLTKMQIKELESKGYKVEKHKAV